MTHIWVNTLIKFMTAEFEFKPESDTVNQLSFFSVFRHTNSTSNIHLESSDWSDGRIRSNVFF